MDAASLLEHEEVTKVKNIKFVKLGRHVMECWYFSPFPKEFYPLGFAEYLYFCEFSLRFFATKEELCRYQQRPALPRHPPGNEIYRDADVSMFELDGAVEKVYCQNLCYFAKLFLDHKTLYWDVDPFLFYVLCSRDERGFHPVGYFSKEKYSDMGYNLACILTFPCVQRNGYGRFLIAFSYELSKKEEKAGSPEKPLSDLGWVGYRSYWAHTLLVVLKDYPAQVVSIMDLCRLTSILPGDVLATLHMLDLVQYSGDRDRATTSEQSDDVVQPTLECLRKFFDGLL
ncbi:acyl-CoA N-acyltransferase [Ochromonadaceae sp. CCMP2298]|nr:acyl-CoA N-acyltransferase [Ochromonadaceae sp. CCMP2298]